MTTPVSVALDRSLVVPNGRLVLTRWVSVWRCELACRDRMAVGDVQIAYNRLIQQDGHALWPLPTGRWNDDGSKFIIHDGRHEYIAALMLGHTHILVAWVE